VKRTLKEPAEKAQRGIQSVEVAGRILDALARRREPVALSELANAAALSTAQAHTYLVSLTKLGLVKRDALTGYYEPGPLSLRLGLMFVEQQAAYRVAARHAAQLAGRIGCSVAVCVASAQGPMIVRYERGGSPLHVNLHIGTVMSLQTTSTGRVFSAFLEPHEIASMMQNQGIDRQRIGTIGTIGAIGADEATPHDPASLDDARRRAMARSIDMPSPGISSLSAPVLDATGRLQLALTVIGPSGTMDVAWNGEIARALRETARTITEALTQPSATHAL
jgi:DNA-binding IclR family transcriptional regulator